MLSIPKPSAIPSLRRSGRDLMRRTVAATLLGTLLTLSQPASAADARDSEKIESQPRIRVPAADAPARPMPKSIGTPAPSPTAAKNANVRSSAGKTTRAKSKKTQDAKPTAGKPIQSKATTVAPAGGSTLQLGLYPRESDAWWAWESLQRRQPELTQGLTAAVSFLDGKTGAGGAVLRAAVGSGIDAPQLCRRIVGAGFGCLIVDTPIPTAAVTAKAESPTPTGPSPVKPATAQPTAPIPAAPTGLGIMAPSTVTVAAAPPTPSSTAVKTSLPVAPQPVPAAPPSAAQTPAVQMPTVQTLAPQIPATPAPSVLAPVGTAAAAPMVPPPAVAAAVPPLDGTVIYSEDEARSLADIEQHSRRKGRLRSVIPDSRIDVMPAALKLANWNLCALTFDDGPHRTVTRQVLEVLNREGVHATYFPVGRVAQSQGDLIRDFVAGGHEIGNHSLTHSDLRAMNIEGKRYEILETNRILRSFGANPVLFRPPYGRYSDELLAIARDEQMSSVLWTVDTRDWKVRDADKIVQNIRTAASPGNVFLMHSTYPSTAQALPRVIAELRAKGCEFVTLSEWLERMRELALPKIVNAGMPPAAPAPTPVTAARN